MHMHYDPNVSSKKSHHESINFDRYGKNSSISLHIPHNSEYV